MRRLLQKNIEQYKQIAKAEEQAPESDTDKEKIEVALQWHISEAAKQRYSTNEAQRRIYELQQDKQDTMNRLHAGFRLIGTTEGNRLWPKGARKTSFENGKLFFNSQPIDIATLITDAEWDIFYALPPTAPKHLQKQYLLGLAKLGISCMLDEQIIADETSSVRTDTLKQKTYTSLQQMDDEGNRFQIEGFIAETLVKNFLIKLSLRFDFDFEITRSDVFDDVENKIDFIIHRKNRYRGVRVEESKDLPKDIGVQFTINRDPDVRIYKERQLLSVRDRIRREPREMPIEDIVLVQLNMGHPKKAYDSWRKAGSPPGGPDDQWSLDLRRQIFLGTLQDILKPAELQAQWSIIANDVRAKASRQQTPETRRLPRNPFNPTIEVYSKRPKKPPTE